MEYVTSSFDPAECDLIASAAEKLLPHLCDLARAWTASLSIDLPEPEREIARKIIGDLNLAIIRGLFTNFSKGDIDGALRFYQDFHQRLISAQIELPDSEQINLEQFFVSAQVAMQLFDSFTRDRLSLDELTLTKTLLCFHKFWNLTLQSLGRIYSHLREAHLESLRQTIAKSEKQLRLLYADAKRAEQALRESEQRFSHFMQNLPGAAFIKDSNGKYIFVNETVERVSNMPLEYWRGKSDLEIWPINGANQAGETDHEVRATGRPLHFIEKMHLEDGMHYWLVTKFPIVDEQGAVSMIGGISLDVTAEKRAEEELKKARDEALESARLKSAFLANMSHEIRTPLNIILGYTSLIAEHLAERGDESQRQLMEGVTRAGRRLIDTIHGILDLSKIETGAFEVRRQTMDVRPLIERQVEDFQLLAREKGLDLSCRFDEADSEVCVDEYCLSQTLSNLLHNAIKFTEKGQIIAHLYRSADRALRLEICDTGVGIDKEYLPRLFQPFSQEQSGYTRSYEGSGLGLALVRKYLELNSASIEVKSQKGHGSCFTICFDQRPFCETSTRLHRSGSGLRQN
jgi:PAS domain S-box-containing protein